MNRDDLSVTFRPATAADADSVAALHADSWQRFYRGAYSDEFLDRDVVADRQALWSQRLAAPGAAAVTIVAEIDGRLTGFVHVVLDDDEKWGSLLDNLHVDGTRQRHGIGAALLARARQAATGSMYLWVLEQNARAQAFYTAQGGRCVERGLVSAPGGVPGRLNGSPVKLRYAW
jgi:ribosomal protein S18 acetylase RimI-like enzyme